MNSFASLQHTLYLNPPQAEWEQDLPRPTSCGSLPRAQWEQAIGGSLPKSHFFVGETFHPFLNCAGDALKVDEQQPKSITGRVQDEMDLQGDFIMISQPAIAPRKIVTI